MIFDIWFPARWSVTYKKYTSGGVQEYKSIGLTSSLSLLCVSKYFYAEANLKLQRTYAKTLTISGRAQIQFTRMTETYSMQWFLDQVHYLSLTVQAGSIPMICYEKFSNIKKIEFTFPTSCYVGVRITTKQVKDGDINDALISLAEIYPDRFLKARSPINLNLVPEQLEIIAIFPCRVEDGVPVEVHISMRSKPVHVVRIV
ncbi:hypothetical protein LTR64_001530 [Lithohypha guttulata]|uniref:uncharacterized protein n=1 Tax=Lithohypha guttulata TaxID=1690604 RepID=UPI002DE17150|nr:hypothetical protein LTR51_003723 [Lithohypha guttulata]